MATIVEAVRAGEPNLMVVLRAAAKKLDSAGSEVVLDFSGVRRIHESALEELRDLALKAEDNSCKLVLKRVSVDVYRVLKLVKLASRFHFGE